METQSDIYFYDTEDKFGYMSNFYITKFTDDKKVTYCCSEQFLTFKKCIMFDPENQVMIDEIMLSSSPRKIKQCGRKVANYDDEKWDSIRYDIMVDSLRLKFKQNDVIKNKLLNTGNKHLYEASKYDNIWGIGYSDIEAINKDKKRFGRNLLGKALMQVREELRHSN